MRFDIKLLFDIVPKRNLDSNDNCKEIIWWFLFCSIIQNH